MTKEQSLKLQLHMRIIRARYMKNVRAGKMPLNQAILLKWDKLLGEIRANVSTVKQ
jgi:hypothetical protein